MNVPIMIRSGYLMNRAEISYITIPPTVKTFISYTSLIMVLIVGGWHPRVVFSQEPKSAESVNEVIKKLQYYAEAGNTAAQYRLAMEYFQGKHISKNNELGLKWATKAAEGGEYKAMIGLGVLYHFGEDIVDPDYKKAMYWYRKASEGYEALAYTYIGILYLDGLGVEKDEKSALEWITRGADNSDALGQAVLGSLYLEGHTVKQDYTKAFDLLSRSAAKGNSLGQYNLGRMYALGLGTEIDKNQSEVWYKKAADQGLPQAQDALGISVLANHTNIGSDISQLTKDTDPQTQRNTETSATHVPTKKSHNNAQTKVSSSGIPNTGYALQVLANQNLARLKEYRLKQAIDGEIWEYRSENETWYLLIAGTFPSETMASQRVQALQQQGIKPWLRPISTLHGKVVQIK